MGNNESSSGKSWSVKANASSRLGNYEYKLIKSPFPLYAVGALWVLYGLLLPLYMWYHFVVLIALSLLCYFIFSRIFPPKQVMIERPYKAPSSGTAEIDKTINDAAALLLKIEAGSLEISKTNAGLSDSADKLILETRGIIDYLSKNTQKASLLRRFFTYYLPTLDKLLSTYIILEKHGAGTENAAQSKLDIEQSVRIMENVFTKQRAKLLDDVVLDISTDIDVLENILGRVGNNNL